MYIVRRTQSRMNQATLENKVGGWDHARGGEDPQRSRLIYSKPPVYKFDTELPDSTHAELTQ
jgi:hypothetical protein